MMGDYHTSKHFKPSLNYCLKDKLTPDGQIIFKDRAEILYYHQCYGHIEELNQQFKEMAALNQQISRPALTLVLSFPTGEQLPKSTLIQLIKECATDLDFEKHQYVAILHKDTSEQHVHIIANRIGYDNHVTNDSYSYGQVADFCRAAELRHNLTRELGPRRYQSKEQRLLPRHNLRLDKLKENIQQSLLLSHDIAEFKTLMQEKGYTVYSQKGIAFMDEKHVVFKGHEAGYPSYKIQTILSRDLSLRQEEERQRLAEEQRLKLEQTRGHHQSERHHQRHSQQLSL